MLVDPNTIKVTKVGTGQDRSYNVSGGNFRVVREQRWHPRTSKYDCWRLEALTDTGQKLLGSDKDYHHLQDAINWGIHLEWLLQTAAKAKALRAEKEVA